MTMEYKRTAGWRGATKSSAGHWLGPSELRSAPSPSLKADSLGDRLAANLLRFSGISNREHRLLEHLLTYRKQTTAPRSNGFAH